MGYRVKKLDSLKRAWKLQFIEYVCNAEKIRDIPTQEYARLGFHEGMTVREAQSRKDQLNAQAHLKSVEVKRSKIRNRLKNEEVILDAYLNTDDVREFEEKILYADDLEVAAIKRNRIESHWRKAKRMMMELKLEPKDFDYEKQKIFAYFARHQLSPSYAKKLLGVLNQWGKFHCRKYRLFYEPIEFPRVGSIREKIADRYFDKEGQGKTSDPITPENLEAVKLNMMPDWYNWFYLSIWFGLRPAEVDQLKKPTSLKTWHAGIKEGTPFLAVYQTKLSGVVREKRTKFIPCIVKEQVQGLKIIESKVFKRPSHARHIKKWFTENTTLYGGRKNFPQLMEKLDQRMEDYHMWLGHQSIERTYRDYKSKKELRFNPVPKSVTQKGTSFSTLDEEDEQ